MYWVRRQPVTSRRVERSGSVTLEFIVAFPIVFIASLAIAEFFFLALVIEGGTTALHEGTRKGAQAYPTMFPLDLIGTDNDIADKIVAVINQHLNVYNVEVVDTDNGFLNDPTKQNATVLIEIDRGMGLETVTRPAGGGVNQLGAPYAFLRTGAAPAVGEIVVTLVYEVVDASNPDGIIGPVPDWLSTFGFSLNGTKFQMTARASLE